MIITIRIGQGQVYASGQCVRSSPRVSGVCHGGAREFARRRPRLAGRLSRVAEKAYRDGISSKFTRKFVEGIEKLVGNTPGDRRKKTRRLIVRMPEAADWQDKPLVSGGCTTIERQVYRRHPGFRAANGD
ncbi:hypothetical protein B296_00030638 [Ensete ventricosum]|uniref:Uncharacterized protein n=1 Tax=Ensete ventricosum TaxID=4639 RepID=A0A426X6A4_ENSVE|nr:hypothetical protein B296_00030638 [Ensete ventricosum]